MNQLHTIKTQLVELDVQPTAAGNNQTRLYFQDQPFLRTKNLVSLEAYCVDDIPLTPLNIALVSFVQMQGAFLTLYGNDPETQPVAPGSGVQANNQPVSQGEWIQFFPLISLHRVGNQNGFVFDMTTFIPRIITWEKSYITLPTPLGNVTDDGALAFLFNVGYMGVDLQVS